MIRYSYTGLMTSEVIWVRLKNIAQYGLLYWVVKRWKEYMTYKYQAEISAIKNCPQNSSKGNNMGYRFVKTPVNQDSFLPQAKLYPNRFVSANDYIKCSSWALSMFLSEQQAIDFFKKLEITARNIRKTLGDHVAELQLTPTHGSQTNANQSGHFDLHEFDGVNLTTAISNTNPIP